MKEYHRKQHEPENLCNRSRTYVEILQRLLVDKRNTTVEAKHLAPLSLLPLIHLDALHIQAKAHSLRRLHIQANNFFGDHAFELKSPLSRERFWLRRHVEASELSQKHLQKFLNQRVSQDIWLLETYLGLEDIWKQAIWEARFLDTEIRDHMALLNGEFSLKESKKSIELANHQIHEGKQGNKQIMTLLIQS